MFNISNENNLNENKINNKIIKINIFDKTQNKVINKKENKLNHFSNDMFNDLKLITINKLKPSFDILNFDISFILNIYFLFIFVKNYDNNKNLEYEIEFLNFDNKKITFDFNDFNSYYSFEKKIRYYSCSKNFFNQNECKDILKIIKNCFYRYDENKQDFNRKCIFIFNYLKNKYDNKIFDTIFNFNILNNFSNLYNYPDDNLELIKLKSNNNIKKLKDIIFILNNKEENTKKNNINLLDKNFINLIDKIKKTKIIKKENYLNFTYDFVNNKKNKIKNILFFLYNDFMKVNKLNNNFYIEKKIKDENISIFIETIFKIFVMKYFNYDFNKIIYDAILNIYSLSDLDLKESLFVTLFLIYIVFNFDKYKLIFNEFKDSEINEMICCNFYINNNDKNDKKLFKNFQEQKQEYNKFSKEINNLYYHSKNNNFFNIICDNLFNENNNYKLKNYIENNNIKENIFFYGLEKINFYFENLKNFFKTIIIY